MGELLPAAVGQRHGDYLRRPHHRLVGGYQAVGKHCRGVEVIPIVLRCDPLHPVSCQVIAPYLLHALHERSEVDVFLVGTPDGDGAVVLEIGGDLSLVAACKVHYEEADLVGLVAGPCHTAPGNLVATGTEHGLGVVAGHSLSEVLAGSGGHVIEIYVGICGESVVYARQLAAGICDLAAVGAPAELLEAPERLSGKFVGQAFEDILALADLAAVERGCESVGNILHEVVPVTVHQAVNGADRGLVKVGIYVGRSGMILH